MTELRQHPIHVYNVNSKVLGQFSTIVFRIATVRPRKRSCDSKLSFQCQEIP